MATKNTQRIRDIGTTFTRVWVNPVDKLLPGSYQFRRVASHEVGLPVGIRKTLDAGKLESVADCRNRIEQAAVGLYVKQQHNIMAYFGIV